MARRQQVNDGVRALLVADYLNANPREGRSATARGPRARGGLSWRKFCEARVHARYSPDGVHARGHCFPSAGAIDRQLEKGVRKYHSGALREHHLFADEPFAEHVEFLRWALRCVAGNPHADELLDQPPLDLDLLDRFVRREGRVWREARLSPNSGENHRAESGLDAKRPTGRPSSPPAGAFQRGR